MTLRLFDSFDYYPDNAEMTTQLQADGWFGGNLGDMRAVTAGTAFGAGKAMTLAGDVTSSSVYRWAGGRYTTTCVIGKRLYFPEPFVMSRIGIYDSQTVGSELQFYLEFDFLGTIRVYSGSGTLIGLSAAGRFYLAKWFYLELKFTVGNPGMVEVRVNTVPVLSYPAIVNQVGTPFGGQSPGWDGIYYYGKNSLSSPIHWDDFYLLDTAGTVNNDYLGNVRVQAQLTTGNSTPLNFAIGGSSPAATNWQSVQNVSLDDSKYVYSPTAGDKDLYTVQAIINAPLVHGVMVKGAYRQDDATQRTVRNWLKAGTTTSEGASHAINQTYTFYWDIWELNPNTGVGWTGSEANALLIGPKVLV